MDIVDGVGAGGVGAVRGGNLYKNKKAGGGLGGRAQRLPPRRIADDHDGGLCFEPVAVVVVVVVVVVASLEKAAQSKATATISTFKTEKSVLQNIFI